jgi:hypothetical protein
VTEIGRQIAEMLEADFCRPGQDADELREAERLLGECSPHPLVLGALAELSFRIMALEVGEEYAAEALVQTTRGEFPVGGDEFFVVGPGGRIFRAEKER